MRRKLLEQAKVLPAFNPVTEQAAGAFKGAAIDRGYNESLVAMVGVGAVSGTPTSFSVAAKLQHSVDATDGNFSDVTDGDLTSLTAINTNTFKSFDISGCKKYIRLVITPAFVDGSSPKVYLIGSVTLGDNAVEPVS